MVVTIDVDTEKYRWSLVGDGYMYNEVKNMSEDKLKEIYIRRAIVNVEKEFERSRPVVIDQIARNAN